MNIVEGELDATLDALAAYLDIDAETLKAYAAEDHHTGWDFDEGEWMCGSLHRPEGQTLYALVRYYKPALVLEYGRWQGCSTTHIAEALEANGGGHIISVDIGGVTAKVPERLLPRVTFEQADGRDHLREFSAPVTFIWEDTDHGYDTTRAFWDAGIAKLPTGGIMVSHDVPKIEFEQHAITDAGAGDAIALRVPPSDCGLGVWIKR